MSTYQPIQNPRPGTFVRSYETESLAMDLSYAELLNFSVGNPVWTKERRDHYLEYPADDRYRELAEQIVADLPEELAGRDFARAAAVKLYLDENMKYTRAVKHEGADCSVSVWL